MTSFFCSLHFFAFISFKASRMFVSCIFVFRRINFQVQLIRSFYLNFTCAYLFFFKLTPLLVTHRPPHSLTRSRSLTVHSLPYTLIHSPSFTHSHTVSHIHSFPYTYSYSLSHMLLPHAYSPRYLSQTHSHLFTSIIYCMYFLLHWLAYPRYHTLCLGNASFNQYKLVGLFLMWINFFTSLLSGRWALPIEFRYYAIPKAIGLT